MPVEHHSPPQGSGGSDPTGAVPDLSVRAQVEAVLRELGITWPAEGHEPGTPALRVDAAALTGAVIETEAPMPFTKPVIAVGEALELALRKEDNRGRVITILLGLFGLAIAGTIAASFRLPAEQSVNQLKNLSDMLLVLVVGALAYYFGRKTQ